MGKRTVIVCDNCDEDIDPGRVYIVTASSGQWKVKGEVCGNCVNAGVNLGNLPAVTKRTVRTD